MDSRPPLAVPLAGLVLGLWLAAYAADNTVAPALSDALAPLLDRGTDDLVAAIAVGLCAWRVVAVREDRWPWALITAGLAAWLAGDLVYTVRYETADQVPFPSLCDLGYLLFPPLTAAGIAGLWRARTREVPAGLWIDAATAALTVGAISAAISWEAVTHHLDGAGAAVVVNLLYPLTDLLLLAAVVGVIAARGWAADRAFVLLGASMLAFWLADTQYLVAVSAGTYAPGAWYDVLWYAAFVIASQAAWQPVRAGVPRTDRVRAALLPVLFGGGALALLALDHWYPIDLLALALALLAIVSMMARIVLLFGQNAAMLRDSREEALTDPLTGLGNRRALLRALDEQVAAATPARPLTLAIYDLDGFKLYNDTFGHPAGDALLGRLSDHLRACVRGRGSAYRMGGDEFCILVAGPAEHGEHLAARAAAALTERGDGFAIGASHGVAVIPRDAGDATQALRTADRALYQVKQSLRSSAGRQSTDVLVRVLAERHPELAAHTHEVAQLAVATADRLGLGEAERELVRQGAELHDVGKIAVPDAILLKPTALDAAEWAFIRQHTVIGERILGAAPALQRVGRLVRSSHERWDGDGYPDGLAGEAIPLAARIVAVCDAYDAMTKTRPYSPAMEPGAALAELERCAGSQFDPAVVEAFRAAVHEQAAPEPLEGVLALAAR